VIEQILSGTVDVLAENSAPSVRNLFAIADGMGAWGELVRSLKGAVCIASVVSVTARAFEEVGIPVDVMPTRPRTADLIRAITHWVATRGMRQRVQAPAEEGAGEFAVSLELIPGATAVRFGPVVVRLGRQEFAVLAALVRRPGVVIRPDDLAVQAWAIEFRTTLRRFVTTSLAFDAKSVIRPRVCRRCAMWDIGTNLVRTPTPDGRRVRRVRCECDRAWAESPPKHRRHLSA
jgi:Uroporphyrinogen-III synthase HemD